MTQWKYRIILAHVSFSCLVWGPKRKEASYNEVPVYLVWVVLMKSIDARMFLLMLRGGAERLEAEKERVNALNVFPVPDGDTGTNMALTMQAALRAAEACGGDHLGRIASAAAQGALLGARGNSGVILSQFFRGLGEALEGLVEADTYEIVRALESAAKAAYKAVLKPVEGTMLSVGRAGAEAAREAAEQGLELSKVLIGAFEGARKMLAETPMLLDVLREAGVVDAGGEGLVVAAHGSLGALQNGTASALAQLGDVRSTPHVPAPKIQASGNGHGHHGIHVVESITYKYCTEFLVHGDQLDAEAIKASLLDLQGDSLLVVGDRSTVKVHLHTNQPWIALESCARYGDLADIAIDNMVLQNQAAGSQQQKQTHSEHEHAVKSEADAAPVAVVAVVQGAGFRALLEELGCTHFVEGGQSMNPSTEEMLAAVEGASAPHVILLPNNRNVRLAAEQVARLSNKEVTVLPSTSIPQAITAMMAFSAERPVEQMVQEMQRALQSVRVGEITHAVRDAKMNGWTIVQGQTIGLTDGNIVGVSDSTEDAVVALVEAMGGDESEIVTLYYGAEVTEVDAQALAQHLQERFAGLDVEVYSGGQPVYQYLVTVE